MKHNYSTLIHFFRTGKIGLLRLGMAEIDLLMYLGMPDSLDIVMQDECVYTYPNMKVQAAAGRIKIIKLLVADYHEKNLPHNLRGDWFDQLATLSIRDASILLTGAGITNETSYRLIAWGAEGARFRLGFNDAGYVAHLLHMREIFF